MAKAKDKSEEEAAKPADSGRVDDAAAAQASASVNPLLSSFAAATAIGFNFASQMAGAMLGSFQGAMEATNKLARTLEEERKAGAAAVSEPAMPQKVAESAPAVVEPQPVVAVAPAKAAPKRAVASKTEAAVAETAPAKAAKSKSAAPRSKAEPKSKPAPEPKAKPAPKAKQVASAAPAAKSKPTEPKAAAEKTKPATKAKPAAESKPAPAPKPAKAPSGRKSAKPDDLKRISGIGPKVEQVLNGMGITRYADIAGWSADEIARVDAEIGFSGRIERDDWVGQAKALMGGKG